MTNRDNGYLSLNRNTIWITVSLLVKAVCVAFFYSEITFGLETIGGVKKGVLGFIAGDTPGYFDPIENLLSAGHYDPDFRMPGYGAVYFVFRLFLSQTLTLDALIITQLTLSALSLYCLAQSVYLITKNKIAFYLSFFLYGLSVRASYWDFMFLTESLTISFTIFAVYFLIQFYYSKKIVHCLLSGFFLTWVIFLRPVYAPLFPVFILSLGLIIHYHWSESLKKVILSCAIFCVPWLAIDGLWIVRNYAKYNTFVPLTKSFYIPSESYMGSLMDFVIAYGGERSYWKSWSEIRWYLPDSEKFVPNESKEPSADIYTSAFNRDSLLAIRHDIQIIEDSSLTPSNQKLLLNSITRRLKTYELSIRKEKPFLYYIKARFIFLKRFLLHSGTDYLPPTRFWDMTIKHQFLKLFNTLTYLGSVFLGAIGIIYALLKRKYYWFIISLIGMYSTLIFPVLGHLEHRYFAPAYPFMLACAIYMITEIIDNGKKRYVNN